MNPTKKTFRVDKNYIYLKSSQDIRIWKNNRVVDQLFGGTTYMLYKPSIRDKMVGDYLTVESNDENLAVIVSDERYSTLDMGGGSSSSGGGGGGGSSQEIITIDSNVNEIKTSVKALEGISTTVTGIQATTDESLTTTKAVSTTATHIDTGIDDVFRELTKFYNAYVTQGGGSSTGGISTVSLDENNAKLVNILAGVNQLQKILICTPRKFDMVLESSEALCFKAKAFDTLLHDDINLYYSNAPLTGTEGSESIRIKFLGGIPQKGNFQVSLGFKSNGQQPYQRDVPAKVEMDELVFKLDVPVMAIDWIAIKGIE